MISLSCEEYTKVLKQKIKKGNVVIFKHKHYEKRKIVKQVNYSVTAFCSENGFPVYFTNNNFLWSEYILQQLTNETN